MKQQTFLFFLFLFSIPIIGFSQKVTYQPDVKIKVKDLQKDFYIFHSAISLGHPAWGQYHSQDSLETWFRQTRAAIQEDLTEKEFLKLLYPLISKLACGHTRLQNSKAFVKYQKERDKTEIKRRYLPFKAVLIDDQLFVYQATSPDSNKISLGSEILSIDGKSAKEITLTLMQRITSDGFNQTYQERVFNTNFDGYYRFYFGEKDHFDVCLLNAAGDTSILNLRTNAATLKERLKQANQRKLNRLKNGEAILQKKGYHLRSVPDQQEIAIMDIRSFRQRKGKGFYRKAFHYLKKKKVSTLVLDLRDNGGGAVKDAGRLLTYLLYHPTSLVARKKRKKHPYEKHLSQKFLYNFVVPILLPLNFKTKKTENEIIRSTQFKPRKKNHFDGNLYVLINGRTFSASVLVAAYLKEENRATFIGQETGGGHAGTNAFLMPKLELPHSGIRIVFPLYTIEHQISNPNIGRGMMPDYEVIYSMEDLLEEKDLELEKLLQILQQ